MTILDPARPHHTSQRPSHLHPHLSTINHDSPRRLDSRLERRWHKNVFPGFEGLEGRADARGRIGVGAGGEEGFGFEGGRGGGGEDGDVEGCGGGCWAGELKACPG